jgi:hypothetical protein
MAIDPLLQALTRVVEAPALGTSCVVTTFLKDENRCKFFNSTGEYFRNDKADSGVKTQAPR